MVREVLRERFIDTLKEFGGSAVNGRMREALGWQDDTYWAVHASLRADGTIVVGRGPGGSVALSRNATRPLPARRASRGNRAIIGIPKTLSFPAPKPLSEEEGGEKRSEKLLAFDWQDAPGDEESSETDDITPLARVYLDLDPFGRVRELHVDQLGDVTSDLRERLDDVLEYGLIADDQAKPLPERLLLWRCKVERFEGGEMATQAFLPVRDGPGGPLAGRMPPNGMRGKKLREWREYYDEGSIGGLEADFAVLVKSAQWIAERAIRGEPLLEVETPRESINLLETAGQLLGASGAAAHGTPAPRDAEPLTLLRATFAPMLDSCGAQRGSAVQAWPEVELDLLLQPDGFPIQTQEHFGRWSLSTNEGEVEIGLATLTPEGELELRGFPESSVCWLTNLMARRPMADEKWCLWRPEWRSSCAYHRVGNIVSHRVAMGR